MTNGVVLATEEEMERGLLNELERTAQEGKRSVWELGDSQRNTRLGATAAVETRFLKYDGVTDIEGIVVWMLEGNISQHYHYQSSQRKGKE